MNLRSTLAAASVAAVLAGCAGGPPIDRSYSAVSQDSRAQFLILHYTHIDLEKSLEVLTKGSVSAHYLVADKPAKIYGLVDENRRAYHAGVSYWKGFTQMNGNSIGIEIVNPGYVDGPGGRQWFDYPPEQIDSVVALVRHIQKQHAILPERILGHSDIAPQRKVDPGPRFPWKRLADEGLIPWPDAAQVAAVQPGYEASLPEVSWFQSKLAEHGYAVPQNAALDTETRNVIAAFQMKYRPAKCDGSPDAETAALLEVLTRPKQLARAKP